MNDRPLITATSSALSLPSLEICWETIREMDGWKGTPKDLFYQLYVVEDKQLSEVMHDLQYRLSFQATYDRVSFPYRH